MSRRNEIERILDEYPKYKETLFIRGYLITDDELDNLDKFPFYSSWSRHAFGKLSNGRAVNIYVNNKQNYYSHEEDELIISIIGHAYNPFDMEHDENKILKKLIEQFRISEESFFNKVSELTGIHLITINYQGRILAVQDCSGMKSCYFGEVGRNIYLTSHPQLVGDLLNLETDSFVEKLIKSKPYNIGNRHLPGNITPYRELKRLGGNTYVNYEDNFTIVRFYPIMPHSEIKTESEFNEGINSIATIIHNNVLLASQKWSNPAISLSGGTDSKTTLSCVNGLYDKFKYFSFHCKPQELVDAKAARQICDSLSLEHSIYSIPDKNEDVEDFYILKNIIDHNTSYFMNLSDHEMRKMIYLYKMDKFDIELKSWASETARVFLERKYKVTMPVKLTERHFSIFQTRYFLVPDLLKKSDELYADFMKETGLTGPIYNFEHTDLFYWEVRMGAWGTSVVSSLDFCHDVTMPINNRKLIEIFLSFPHEDRKSDRVHKEVIKVSDKRIEDMNIEVKNLYFHSYRIWIEKTFYYYKTLLFRSKL